MTLPRDVRRHLGIKDGDTIALIPQGDHAILRPIPHTLLDLRGSVPVSGIQDFDAIREQVKAEIALRTETDRLDLGDA
jgi:bifunctional DNA-binding transcriptional regulator/antitoxin component of YhaV-PrlF toxin-antitoxin module